MLEFKKVKATIRGTSPLCFGKQIMIKKDAGESHEAFEERTWKERLHVADDGEIFIPPMAIHKTLYNMAKYFSETIPGKGKATYTKHILSGVMVTEPVKLGMKADDVENFVAPYWMSVPSDGVRGGNKRVMKCFPLLNEWEGEIELTIIDKILQDDTDKIKMYLENAGVFIGLLSFRPQNGSWFGRFNVENFRTV